MRRSVALALTVAGQSSLALVQPSIAAVPAFASFLAAGLVLVRS